MSGLVGDGLRQKLDFLLVVAVGIRIELRNFTNLVLNLDKGVDHVRVEVAATTLDNDLRRFLMRQPLLVDPPTDQRVIDVGDGHQPSGDRNTVTDPRFRIAAAIPFFLMTEGNLLGNGEKLDLRAEPVLGELDGIPAEQGVVLHDFQLVRLVATRLQQDAVGDADFADVMEGRRLE